MYVNKTLCSCIWWWRDNEPDRDCMEDNQVAEAQNAYSLVVPQSLWAIGVAQARIRY